MSEIQPDMLGGKSVPGSRLRRIRRTGRPPTARSGWADKPGSGPEGETCGSCTYCDVFHFRKRYYKCAARDGDHWKGGRKTDIQPLDPACSKWAPSINRTNTQRPDVNAKAIEADPVTHADPRPGGNPRRKGSAERPIARQPDGRGRAAPVDRDAPEHAASDRLLGRYQYALQL